MVNDLHYVPGSFYRICERTGFKTRSYRTKKEWNGRIVRDGSWEARHPQDFVRGRKDDMRVPESRPRQTNTFVSQTVTLPNLIASNDEQMAGWPGVIVGTASSAGATPNAVLSQAGGTVDASVYSPVSSIDAGSVRNLQVWVNCAYVGLPSYVVASPFDLYQVLNLFGIPDLFSTGTMQLISNASGALPTVWTAFVFARIEISTATVAGQWSEWKPVANTIYNARYIRLRCVLGTNDINTACLVVAFNWQVGTV